MSFDFLVLRQTKVMLSVYFQIHYLSQRDFDKEI